MAPQLRFEPTEAPVDRRGHSLELRQDLVAVALRRLLCFLEPLGELAELGVEVCVGVQNISLGDLRDCVTTLFELGQSRGKLLELDLAAP